MELKSKHKTSFINFIGVFIFVVSISLVAIFTTEVSIAFIAVFAIPILFLSSDLG